MAHNFSPRDFGSIAVRTPLVAPGQRIGLMGGTFNPPHEGHRIVAETALKRLRLDQVWWVVTPGNPLKENGGLPAQDIRMEQARKFARGPKMKITGFEAELGTPYTAATIAFLLRRFPNVRFVWVMGADNLASFHRWQRWQSIAASVPIAVVDRPNWRLKAIASLAAQCLAGKRIDEADAASLPEQKPPAWTFLTSRLSPLSSTALRARDNQAR